VSELPEAVIFDVDGTLCDVRSIRHLVAGPRRDFHSFHMRSVDCPPNEEVKEAAHHARQVGRAVIVVTARMECYRHVTSMWLALNQIPSDALYMRRDGDFRKDFLVKREILAKIRRRWNPVHAWDDNPEVIALWQQENIECTVVPGWDDRIGKGEK
jgi:phosphoglycolate phosphatase-like HAD superfamily hydrolase